MDVSGRDKTNEERAVGLRATIRLSLVAFREVSAPHQSRESISFRFDQALVSSVFLVSVEK